MKKKEILSSKEQIIKTLLIFAVPFVFFLIAYNTYTINELNKRLAETGKNMLEVYSNSVNMDVYALQRYMVDMMANDSGFRQLVYTDKQYEQYIYMQEVGKKLRRTFSTSTGIAGYIIYEKSNNILKELYVGSGSYRYEEKMELKNILMENAAKDALKQNYTEVRNIGNHGFLLRTVYEKNIYMMMIYDLDKALYPQNMGAHNPDTLMLLTDLQLNPLTSIDGLEQNGITLKACAPGTHYFSGKPYRYLIMQKPMEELPLNVVYAAPYYGLFSTRNMIPMVFFLVSILLVLLMWRSFRLLEKKYLAPFNNLIDTMAVIENGNMETRLENQSNISEFQILANSFNAMMEKIKALKIESYQYEIEMQQTKLQYLQIQIRPHFFLNCLKNLYGLAEEDKSEEIQKMILVLSKYFRYMMRDNFLLVSSETELENVENYITLQQMTAFYPISCHIDMDDSLKNFMIPPLSVLTFVENSIKHAKPAQGHLKIQIRMSRWKGDQEDYVVITILDNGVGFSQESLSDLNSSDGAVYRDKHIGIQNVKHRFSLLYKGKAQLLFSNMTGSGACIQIFIPVQEKEVQ